MRRTEKRDNMVKANMLLENRYNQKNGLMNEIASESLELKGLAKKIFSAVKSVDNVAPYYGTDDIQKYSKNDEHGNNEDRVYITIQGDILQIGIPTAGDNVDSVGRLVKGLIGDGFESMSVDNPADGSRMYHIIKVREKGSDANPSDTNVWV